MKWQHEHIWIDSLINNEESPVQKTHSSKAEAEEYTTEFLQDLRVTFSRFIQIFNDKKQDLGALKIQALRIFKIANTKADFVLFRNGYHLIFSATEPGLIRVRFSKDSQEDGLIKKDSYLQACFTNHMSAVKWKHHDYEGFVEINSLARYYMKLFTKASVLSKKVKI